MDSRNQLIKLFCGTPRAQVRFIVKSFIYLENFFHNSTPVNISRMLICCMYGQSFQEIYSSLRRHREAGPVINSVIYIPDKVLLKKVP